MYSLPTLSSLCPKKRKSVLKRAFTYKDWHEMLPPYFKCVLQKGQPPPFLSMQHGDRQGVVDKSPAEIQAWPNLNAWQPYQERLKQTFNKKGPSLWISRDLMLKKTLSFQPDSRGKWMPNYEDPCAITHVTANVDKPACRCSQEILCQKSIKSKNQKLNKSQTWNGDLGKNERLGGLKTRKGGPGKIRDIEQK